MKQKTGCTVLFLHSTPTTGMLLPQTEVYCVIYAIYTVLCIYIKEIDIHVCIKMYKIFLASQLLPGHHFHKT